MAARKKDKVRYVCQSCGYVSLRWLGRCSECGEWNSLIEERVTPEPRGRVRPQRFEKSEAVPLNKVDFVEESRISCASREFNRVLGGGIVPGSLILVGGDPGIGKSTLLLQEAARMSRADFPVLYVSGEESHRQTRLRAQRLGIDSEHLFLLAETNQDAVIATVEKLNPGLLIIDSIQTMYQPAFESAPGSISQVRECALSFLNVAKSRHLPVILVGHVTKDGYLAGPKVLEHMVDTLLQFEGDRHQHFRILRAMKNRFGSTREIGIFEMSRTGLHDVSNPSEIFLAQRSKEASGSAVVCTLEGSRPILVEVQALVTRSNYGMPQRTAAGFEAKRLALLLAVLEKRIGLRLGTQDVFLNVAGGVRLDEPAADLGIVTAIASSMRNTAVQHDAVFIGEIGLAGEIRFVPQMDKRLHEAAKLGFKTAIIPPVPMKDLSLPRGFQVIACNRLDESFDKIF